MTSVLDRRASAPLATSQPNRPTRDRAPDAWIAEVALGGLTLAAVFGLSRLFTHPARFFVPVAVVAVAVHAVAWAGRRARLNLAWTALMAAVTAILTTTWTVLGSSTAYGLPGHGTAHAARIALDHAATVYRSSAAPVAVIPGFTLAAATGAAIAAFLADWAGFRMRATTEACLPSFSLFILSAALAQGHGVIAAGAVWLVALLTFLLARQPALESASTAWFASRSRRGPRTILVTGVLLAGGATLLAAVVGPQLPGATIHPIFNWRAHGPVDRTLKTSPLVDITARLKSLSHREVFTVLASRPTYWRLTALDVFNGAEWAVRDNGYTGATRRLPMTTIGATAADTGPTTDLRAEFRIGALASIWLPVPYRPSQLAGTSRVSFSSDTGSLITDGSTSDNLTYSVDSSVPAASPPLLETAPPADLNDPAIARYLQLPNSVSPTIRLIALQVTQGQTTEYGKARALQDWLRSPPFRYDLNVRPDESQDALLNFLTVSRAGFCQQFAASYAVLARSLGIPTRVAVGFTEGTLAADGLYHVTDAEAHAWPEVYFPGVGWTAFEPTPARGSPDPAAQAVTGAPPAQQVEAPPSTLAPAPTTAAPATAPSTPRRTPTTPDTTPPKPKSAHRSLLQRMASLLGVALIWLRVFAGLVALPLLWIGALAAAGAVLRTRRRARATTPSATVDLAWAETREVLTVSGAPPFRWETPAEFARRASHVAALPEEARQALGDVARAVEIADYSPTGPTAETAEATTAAAGRVRRAIYAEFRWQDWARVLLDPRPLGALISRRA